jgi:hypothetical protein
MKSKLFLLLAFCVLVPMAIARVLYYDNFDGSSGVDIHGTAPDIDAAGGAAWTANTLWKADGSVSSEQVNAGLPFVPQSGKVYQLTVRLTTVTVNWLGVGFAQGANTNSGITARWNSTTVPANPWILHREVTSALEDSLFLGPQATLGEAIGNLADAVDLRIILDTRPTLWKVTGAMRPVLGTSDFTTVGTANRAYTTNPTIASVGMGSYGSTSKVDSLLLEEIGEGGATTPSPAYGEVDVPMSTAAVSWNAGSAANITGYYFYMAEGSPDFSTATPRLVTDTVSPIEAPVALKAETSYFWRADASINGSGPDDPETVAGSVWFFTTNACNFLLAGDVSKDCQVNLEDFAVIAEKWLLQNGSNPSNSTGQLAIMQYWAPVVYQDFKTGTDYDRQMYGAKDAVVALDFDGNWNVANNWDNSIYQVDQQGSPLYGKVYSSFIETDGFYFLKYGFYHAGQDSGDLLGYDARHQNDWEVVVLAIQKNGTEYGSLEAMVAQAHTGENHYTASQLQFSQHRPIIYIQPNGLLEGHGISAYSGQSPGDDGVVYQPAVYSENVVSCDVTTSGNWATAPNYTYKLIPLGDLWALRGYSYVFATYKLLNYDPLGEEAGGYLTWDKEYFNDPITYFGANFSGLTADLAGDQYVFHPYYGYDSSQTGPANPLGFFPASEWSTTTIGGGFGLAWPHRSGCTLYRKDSSGGDDAAYTYRTISGNFEISTKVHSVQAAANHRAGLMMRNGVSADAPFIALSVDSGQQVHVSYRQSDGAAVVAGPDGTLPADDRPVWIKLDRIAEVVKASYSYDDDPSYIPLFETTIALNTQVNGGISASTTATAVWACSSFEELAVFERMLGDISGPGGEPDDIVDIYDLLMMSDQWLSQSF